MLSIRAELQALAARLHAEEVPYALCGALALAVHGYPQATLDIDLLALDGSAERILQCGRTLGFTLKAAPVRFGGGKVRIERFSKAVAGHEDVLMLDVLSLATVDRPSLVQLKMLRGSTQDLADVEKLA